MLICERKEDRYDVHPTEMCVLSVVCFCFFSHLIACNPFSTTKIVEKKNIENSFNSKKNYLFSRPLKKYRICFHFGFFL